MLEWTLGRATENRDTLQRTEQHIPVDLPHLLMEYAIPGQFSTIWRRHGLPTQRVDEGTRNLSAGPPDLAKSFRVQKPLVSADITFTPWPHLPSQGERVSHQALVIDHCACFPLHIGNLGREGDATDDFRPGDNEVLGDVCRAAAGQRNRQVPDPGTVLVHDVTCR